MAANGEFIVVYITASDEEEARRIGREVVARRLAACANIVPAIASYYHWQGQLTEDREALLLLKTRRACFDRLIAAVKELHSYSVPAVNALPVLQGNPDYLSWVAEETSAGGEE